MPKYVIEREIPDAGKLSASELQAISQKSCGVLNQMGPQIQWVQSYVTDDKVYCVYIAPNEEMVRDHARQGEFPANKVSEVKTIIDPTTAEVSPLFLQLVLILQRVQRLVELAAGTLAALKSVYQPILLTDFSR